MLYAHFLFWSAVVVEQVEALTYFTSWGLFFTMMTFTLLVIDHIIEAC